MESSRRDPGSAGAKGVWSGKRVLVTGAGGFIGSHLAEALVRSGAEVRAFLHYNSRNDWGMLEFVDEEPRRAMEIRSGDIRDAAFVRQAVHHCDVVFHLAALIGIPYSFTAPESFIQTNVLGTLNVLQACVDLEVERVVHTSTSEVYGTAQYTPIDEHHPLHPQSPYAASKVGADTLTGSFYHTFGLPVSILRPFNTYGPRQSARAVIPTIVTQALVGEAVALGTLETTRDMTFVGDTVQGFLGIAESASTVGEVVNIGTAHGVTVRDLAEHIGGILGKRLELVLDTRRVRPETSEVDTLIAGYGKATRLTGWVPRVKLDDGLRQTVRWISQHLERYKPGVYNV